jgi:hypothetical protein
VQREHAATDLEEGPAPQVRGAAAQSPLPAPRGQLAGDLEREGGAAGRCAALDQPKPGVDGDVADAEGDRRGVQALHEPGGDAVREAVDGQGFAAAAGDAEGGVPAVDDAVEDPAVEAQQRELDPDVHPRGDARAGDGGEAPQLEIEIELPAPRDRRALDEVGDRRLERQRPDAGGQRRRADGAGPEVEEVQRVLGADAEGALVLDRGRRAGAQHRTGEPGGCEQGDGSGAGAAQEASVANADPRAPGAAPPTGLCHNPPP